MYGSPAKNGFYIFNWLGGKICDEDLMQPVNSKILLSITSQEKFAYLYIRWKIVGEEDMKKSGRHHFNQWLNLA